jgi:hypothetical protein
MIDGATDTNEHIVCVKARTPYEGGEEGTGSEEGREIRQEVSGAQRKNGIAKVTHRKG